MCYIVVCSPADFCDRMNKEELQKLYKQLTEEKERIIAQLKTVAVENPAVKGDFEPVMPHYEEGDHDDDESLNEATQFGTDIAMQSELEKRLEEINSALAKIENETYGSCSNCSSPISAGRLQAMPTATLCINCAQQKPL